jgi:DNA sulfur modification protein DndC
MTVAPRSAGKAASALAEQGLARTVAALGEEIRELYRGDAVPWIVGYSGGKDSSAALQLVWLALRELPPEQRTKPVHVISTDTLVEQPLVAAWVDTSLERMRTAAREQGLPLTPHKLTPEVEDSFWVNLIGKGYPAPRMKFRWCTERLKIRPSNKFIREVVRQYGEAILVLGTRKAESLVRAKRMTALEQRRVRERLSPNAASANSLVYTPIEDWSNDDVWLYLMQVKNPWGHDNKSLLGMYQGASEGGECPLVVDTSTPSCGSSRFGCWVCTVVDKDRSMEAMIRNDEEKAWMAPLLELRNELDKPDDRDRRDYRRMNGQVQLMNNGTVVPGPYTKHWREQWLRRVLEAQQAVHCEGPEEFRTLRLITPEELQEIRRIWLYEKHEFDDALPRIFEEVTGEKFPLRDDDAGGLRADDWALLKELCGEDQAFFELQVGLLGVERQFRGMSRRTGVFRALEERLQTGLFGSEQEAVEVLTERKRREEWSLEVIEISRAITEANPRDQDEARDKGYRTKRIIHRCSLLQSANRPNSSREGAKV